MATQSVEKLPSTRSLSHLTATLFVGVVFGAVVAALAFLVARYGPSGDSWSFRGNGALAVYSLILPLVAGGWTAIVLFHRGRSAFLLASAATVIGVVLAVSDAALLPLFGRGADQTVGPIVLLGLIAWTFLCPFLAMRLPRGNVVQPGGTGSAIAAALLWTAGLAAGLVVVSLAFPAGS